MAISQSAVEQEGKRGSCEGLMCNAHTLLSEAFRVYESRDHGRHEPFNVFTVLRTETDEVNLHSRFLAALLDWTDPLTGEKKNLKDFLDTVAAVTGFGMQGATVDRERHNIDILIANARRQAVLIENKIKAEDRPRQLVRYHGTLMNRGFDEGNIHVLYLTRFGDEPSEDSSGALRYGKIAYRDRNFQDWLRNCRNRACADPALRESIRQYLQLVQRMTGTDWMEAYMRELRQLSRQGANLVVIHDLKEASNEVHVAFLQDLFEVIEARLRQELEGLPPRSSASDVSADTLKHLITARKLSTTPRIRFELGTGSALCVWVDDRFSFGIACDGNHPDRSDQFRGVLEGFYGDGKKDDDGCPWYRYVACAIESFRTPSRGDMKILADEEARRKAFETLSETLAREMGPVWERIRVSGLKESLREADTPAE